MKHSQRFLAVISALLMAGALAMTGCGGSSSSNPQAGANTTITGQVVDGIIAGATCSAYQVNSNGTKGTLAGGPAPTDANGNYTITMSYSGPVLVECAGGSYKDWATGNTVTLTSSDVISAVIPDASGTVTGNITPLTYMAAKLALQDMAANATAAATAVTNANSSIGQYFGITDIISTPVIDPTVSGSATGATQATKDYSLVLAGISKYAATNSITNPFQLVVALANDASDGTFDGKEGGTTQQTVTTTTGSLNLSTSTSASDLSTAITTFQSDNTINLSGATIGSAITTTLSGATGTLPQPLPATPTGVTATAGDGQVTLSWNAVLGATSYRIYQSTTPEVQATGFYTSVSSSPFTTKTGAVTNGTTYYFVITAVNATGESAISAEISGTPTAVVVVPSAPTISGFDPTSGAVGTTVTITGTNFDATAANNTVKFNGTAATVSAATATSITCTVPTGATNGTVTVTTADGTATSAGSFTVVSPPSVPTGVTATAGDGQASISWGAVTGATYYNVYRSTTAGVTKTSGTKVAANITVTNYTDTGIANDTAYYYIVTAVNGIGESAESIQVSATPTVPLAQTPGVLDTTFDGDGKVITGIGSSADVAYAVAIQSDGKIVAAGYSYNGPNFALVRYNADGTLDTTFDADGKVVTGISSVSAAYAVAIQSDGKIVAAGYTTNGSDPDFALVRYNADGTLDMTFDADGKVTTGIGSSTSDYAYAVAIQPDGKIVAAGYSSINNGDFVLVRYNSNGSLDTTFGTSGKVTTAIGTGTDQANAVAIQPDGKIVAAGFSANGTDRIFALVRYNANGTLDTTFGTDGKITTAIGTYYDIANAVAIQSDGKILAVGSTETSLMKPDFALVRYNSTGTLDVTFGTSGIVTTGIGNDSDAAFAVTIQSDGKIVAAGDSNNGTYQNSDYDIALVRYNADGTLDTTFDTDGIVTTGIGTTNNIARAVACQSDGRIVAAGYTYDIITKSDFALVRYLP